MITRFIQRFSKPIVLGTGFLLLVDLFFHWRQAPVHTRWIDTTAATSALAGWGAIAVGFLFAFLVVELTLGRRARAVAAGLAIGAAAMTSVEFFLGSAGVTKSDGAVVVSAEQTLWPAYAGLGLAALLVLAAVNRLFAPPPARLPLPPMLTSVRLDRQAAVGSTV